MISSDPRTAYLDGTLKGVRMFHEVTRNQINARIRELEAEVRGTATGALRFRGSGDLSGLMGATLDVGHLRTEIKALVERRALNDSMLATFEKTLAEALAEAKADEANVLEESCV